MYKRIAAIPEFNINYNSRPCVAIKRKGPEASETCFAALRVRQSSLRRNRISASSGTRTAKVPDRSGRLQNTVGKWMSVFKKQPDGSWGAVADTYNVDPPP